MLTKKVIDLAILNVICMRSISDLSYNDITGSLATLNIVKKLAVFLYRDRLKNKTRSVFVIKKTFSNTGVRFFTNVFFLPQLSFLSETVKFNDSELSRSKIEDVWPYQSQNNHITQLIKGIVIVTIV